METSLFVAKILGPCFLIIGLGLLFNRGAYQRMMADFCKNAALMYLGGLFALLFGLLIVLFHNVWAADWVVIITIFGWGGIIKGIWLLVFPNTVSKFTDTYLKNETLLLVHSALVVALGAVLSMYGYFML